MSTSSAALKRHLEAEPQFVGELNRYPSFIESIDPHNLRSPVFHLPRQLKSLKDCRKRLRIATINFSHEPWFRPNVDAFLSKTELCIKHFNQTSSSNQVVFVLVTVDLVVCVAMNIFFTIRKKLADPQNLEFRPQARNEQSRRIRESILNCSMVREGPELSAVQAVGVAREGRCVNESELLFTTLLAVSLNGDEETGLPRSTIVRAVAQPVPTPPAPTPSSRLPAYEEVVAEDKREAKVMTPPPSYTEALAAPPI